MENLKPYQKKVIHNLFNVLGENKEIITNDDVKENLDEILSYILNGDYATTTKRDYLIIISNVFKESDKELYKYIQNEAKKYNNIYLKKEIKQELDEREKEHYITYGELLDKLEEVIYKYQKFKNYKNFVDVVLLALYVLQPPLRNDYYNIIFIDDIEQEKDKTKNYLLKTGSDYSLIINNDKVIKSHGRAVIPIKNLRLINILGGFIIRYVKPNEYLFMTENGEPYKKKRIQYILNQLFKSEGKVLTIYNLRSAYITNFYNLHKDLLSREELARQMRHSKSTAELIYYKIKLN
jgi:hypothetical protein